MKSITICTRGASKGNPGPAAIGVCVTDAQGKIILEVSESIGNATSEYAEYFSVVRGLQVVQDMFSQQTLQMDFELKQESQLVDNHLHAKEEIKDVSLIGHFIEIYNLRVGAFPNLTVTRLQRAENQAADRLVNEALDGGK